MSQPVKFQLGLFSIVIIYFIIRLLGISDLDLNLYQQIYYGNFIKDSLMLFVTFSLSFFIFNKARKLPLTGPTIIKGRILKKLLISIYILGWLAVVSHTIFDSIKILLPLNLLSFYQFAETMDETISHIFIFVPTLITFFILTILEIQRPSLKKITKLDIFLLTTSSLLIGLVWGPNLSEGNLSIITSFPIMIFYLLFSIFIIKKYNLKLRFHPWMLFSLITDITGIISYIIWSLVYSSSTQLFMILK